MKNKFETRGFLPLIFIMFFISIGNSQTFARNGDLDNTFDNDGVTTKSYSPTFNLAPFSANAIQTDGKILFASIGVIPVTGGTTDGFTVIRYNSNGTLDANFGINGVVNTNVGNFEGLINILLQPDGKIILSGERYSGTNLTDFVLVRYNSDGSLDNSFDGNGVAVATIFALSEERGGAAALQSDGKIVIAGQTDNQTNNTSYDWAIVRFNSDGSLDNTFDGDAKVVLSLGGDNETARSVAVQQDGRIVVTGFSSNGANNDFTTVRLNSNGSIDQNFGMNGVVKTQINNFNDFASDVVIQPDNKILVTGTAANGMNDDIAVVRYAVNGNLDSSFGTNGKIIISYANTSNEDGFSLALQQNGKIVVSGRTGNNVALLRFNENGTADADFGINGKVSTPILNANSSIGYSVALQNDGNIVVSGTTRSPGAEGPAYYFTARYIGNSPNNKLFDYDGDGKADVSVFRPSNGGWYLNNSNIGFSATSFGVATDKIVPADFDGDGKTDVSIFRNGVWYRLNSSNGAFSVVSFGQTGDIPIAGDFDGDGKADQAVYRGGVWYLNRSTQGFTAISLGVATDKPIAADYDGDGKTDVSVFRDGAWYYIRSSDSGFAAVSFGIANDIPAAADYDGDGKADQAIFRNGIWYILQSQNGFTSVTFGAANDILVPADYDGDGKADVAIFRNGIWYLLQTTAGFSAQAFGATDDKPTPSAYIQ